MQASKNILNGNNVASHNFMHALQKNLIKFQFIEKQWNYYCSLIASLSFPAVTFLTDYVIRIMGSSC